MSQRPLYRGRTRPFEPATDAAPAPDPRAPGVAAPPPNPNPVNGPGGVTPPRITPTPTPGPTLNLGGVKPFQGFTPRHAMEGFDFAREQDPAKSAKDAFAYFSNQAPPPPLNDKAALGVWFKTYIQPGMQQLGHNVTDVDGDKFRFNNWQGDFWVDYGRGAGANGGALAWQADYAQGGPGGQAYQQTQRAIMGVPQPQPSTWGRQSVRGSVAQSVLQPLQPAPVADPGMSDYYTYLQQLLQGQDPHV